MFVLVLASRKGGAGKTTLCRHLAVEALRQQPDSRVALIDADPMGGLSRWWNRRKAELPEFIQADQASIAPTAERLRRAGYSHLFIDTPPQASESVSRLILLASLVVVPTRASPDDLWAVGETVDLVEHAARPMVFVVNSATKNARMTAQAAVALSQHGTVAPAVVHQSVAIPASAVAGQTVGETEPGSASAREFAELWAYLAARLAKVSPPTQRVNRKAS